MLRKIWWIERTHAADGSAGVDVAAAAAAPAAAPSAAPAAAPTGSPLVDAAKAAPAADAAAPTGPYMPDGLPETFKGKSEREIIDKLWKAESERAKPPATAAEYKLEVPKELQGVINPENDKVLPLWREIAHKHGLSQAQFQSTIVDLQAAMTKAGLIEKPLVAADEFAALGEGAGDRAAQLQKGQTRVLELASKIEGLATRQALSKEEAALAVQMLGTRQSVQLFEKLLALAPAEKGLAGGGQPGAVATDTPHEQRLKQMFPSMFRVS